jgi:hypothetical protein
MGRVFIPAVDAKTVPVVRSGAFATGQTYIKGAVLGGNAAGELIELASGAGVPANSVWGVALESVNSKPGFYVANDNLVVFRTGTVQETSIVDLPKQRQQVFSGRFTDGAGVDVTPTQAIIMESRGLLRLASGEWTVNSADAANDAVQIVDIVLPVGSAASGNYILFRFLDAVIAIGANVP